MTTRPCLLLLLVGCFGPTEPEPVRYHAPVATAELRAEDVAPIDRPLRLRRVSSASSIRERVLWRDPKGEIGYFELDRWAERPVDVLERVLARGLFEERGLRRSEAASALALDVHLIAFELVLGEDRPAACVRIVAHLFERSGGAALLERTFEERVQLEAERPGPELSQALGSALVALSGELVDAVLEATAEAESAP